MKNIFILVSCIFSCITTYSQGAIKVYIYNEKNEPVEGVNFNINDKSIYVEYVEDYYWVDTSFIGKKICLSHIMYTLECQVIEKNEQMIVLKRSVGHLDEAIVIAYDNTSKRYSTGNITKISESDIQNRFSANNLVAIQGLSSGLDIAQTSGLVGSSTNVKLQGMGSIGFSGPPLYVIDGIPQQSYISSNILSPSSNIWASPRGEFYRGNITDYIDINNIESVTVLKDADATSIYGSRGANGVIIITTKQKSISESSIEITQNFTWSKMYRRFDMMNTDEYLYMRKKAIENDGITNINGGAYFDITRFDSTEYTDWQEVFLNETPVTVNSHLLFRSSGKNYYNGLSINYLNNDQFFSAKGKFESIKLTNSSQWSFWKDRLIVKNVLSYMHQQSDQVSADMTRQALFLAPNFPRQVLDADFDLRTDDGNLIFTSYQLNTLANIRATENLFKSKTLNNSLNLKLDIISALSYDIVIGYTNTQSDDRNYIDREKAKEVYGNPTILSVSTINNSVLSNRSIESYFTYKFVIKKIDLSGSVIAGYSYNESNFQQEQSTYVGFVLPELFPNFSSASNVQQRNFNKADYKYKGYFIRMNTLLLKKIMLNANYRMDGSSRFAPENRWSDFYSLALGWVISDENFFRNLFSQDIFFKIRTSYGISGNDAIPNYAYLYQFLYSNNNLYNYGIITPQNVYNPSYKWEKIEKLNLGFDFSFSNKVDLSFNYTLGIASNQLLSLTLPSHLSAGGSSSQFVNMPAVFHNQSFETEFKIYPVNNSWLSFFVQGNMTIPSSILKSFPGNLSNSPVFSSYQIGKPTQGTLAASITGVDPISGLYLYQDSAFRTTTNSSLAFRERVSVQPRFYSSLILGFDFKKFIFRTHFYYYSSRNVNNSNYYYSSYARIPGAHLTNDFLSNQERRFLDNWDINSTNAQYQRFSTSLAAPLFDKNRFNYYYLRIQNISVTFPFRKILLVKNGSFDFNISNILLSTNARSFNYEASGVSLPPLTSFSSSLKINL